MKTFHAGFTLVLLCTFCTVSVKAVQDPVAVQAARKANKFVGILVAARCPSQSKKVQNFLVGRQRDTGDEFSELAIKLGEEKALSMAEDLCEGAADDKGIIAYNDVPFHYANVGAALNQVQTRAHLKRAEEQAFLVAEKAFHEALKAQQLDLGYKPQDSNQGEGAGTPLPQEDKLPVPHAKPKQKSSGEAKSSGPSVLLVLFFLLLIGGGLGTGAALHLTRSGGELPPNVLLMWIKVKDVAGPLLVRVFEKSKDLVYLAIDCVQQRSKSATQKKEEMDSKVAEMSWKIEAKMHSAGSKGSSSPSPNGEADVDSKVSPWEKLEALKKAGLNV